MLKKFFVTSLMMTFFIVNQSNVCNADIPRSEISLGGIGLFNYNKFYYRSDYVEKIYGKPTGGKSFNTGFDIWCYGNSVTIGFLEGLVSSVSVTANNGWKTPSGLAVGMKIDDAVRMYGHPDYIKSNANKILYVYFGNPRQFDVNLSVLANRNDGKILSLTVHGSSMADLEQWFPRWVENILK